MAAVVMAVSVPWLLPLTPVGAAGVAVKVSAVTQPVTNASASQTPATAGCPAGTVLVGGGIHVFHAGGDQVVVGSIYEPINGLVIKGTLPTDASGSSVPSADPANWTALGGFAGQSEAGDNVTAFAMCSTGGPIHTQVVTATVNGPTVAATTAKVTASCPAGTRLVGGGAQTEPFTSPSSKPVGSYPSDATGSTATATDLDSWTAVGAAGGQANPSIVTTAFALCSTDVSLHTRAVRTDVIDHPAGQGNSNPGQDPVATATATCPVGSTLLDGGALADGNAPGPDGGTPQQGVHVRGSYPSDAAGQAVADGTAAPTSWSSIVQSGGQATPGTDTHAFALCAQAPAAPSADLAITKTGPATGTVGTAITYSLKATNNGTSDATGVTVTDTLPAGVSFGSASAGCTNSAGTVTCTVGNLAAGASATITISVTPTTAGSFTDTATIGGNEPDPNPANNSASATTVVGASADLSVTKTVTPVSATVGGPLRFTVIATNHGPSPATGVAVTDTLPGGVTYSSATSSQGSCSQASGTVSCGLGGLAIGATATVTINVTATTAGTFVNTARVAGSQPDPNQANNTASAGFTVSNSGGTGADLSLTKTASPNPVTVGGTLTYTLSAGNSGPATATGVVVTDTLPAGVTLVSTASSQGTWGHTGSTVTCHLGTIANHASAVVTITVRPTAAGTITNTARVAGAQSDPNPANNAASVTTTVSAVAAVADVAISKFGFPNPVNIGGSLFYLLVVENHGPATATGVKVVDNLPAGVSFGFALTTQGACTNAAGTVTCTIGTLPSGRGSLILIQVNAHAEGTITNTATISANEFDPFLANNSATTTTTVW